MKLTDNSLGTSGLGEENRRLNEIKESEAS
jgi:hypothetical protein